MGGVAVLVALFIFVGIVMAMFAFLAYRRVLRRAKSIERGLKTVPLLIHLPPPSSDTEIGTRDQREVVREKISQAEVLYDLIAGTAQSGFKSSFYGQRHIAFEIIASNGLIHFFAAVPIALVSTVEQAIVTAYPGAHLQEVEDHNIFNPQGRLSGTMGGELTLRHDTAYPIATYDTLERDPMEALLNALSKLKQGEGAAVQIMMRPARANWVKKSQQMVFRKRNGRSPGGFGAGDIAKAMVKSPAGTEESRDRKVKEVSKLEEDVLQAIERKTTHSGYEVLIRVLTSSPNVTRSEMMLRDVSNAFSLYEAPGLNGFQFTPARDVAGLVTAFIFRFFPPELTSNILNTQELATIFHIPDDQHTSTSQLERQTSKQVDGPVGVPSEGLLFGYNLFRGVQKEIRLSVPDRRRHTYIVGQTGTGKSTILENLAVQDMLSGGGFAFIDPHGDTAEKLLTMVPKNRAEDVIYFNPADTENPMGLNMFEYDSPQQKDFLIQESLNILIKIYDPNGTGVIGPRFEQWFRNAALTLMSDPNGSTFIEIPKVFGDSNYLKQKFKHVTDQTVIDFWTQEMGQTSDYHKSEMLGYFVSKFGAFQQNEIMRNIMGQTKSAFNMRDIMDNKKILIVNLSKGGLGEMNSKLLGMIFVMKFQAAAMSRADMDEDKRNDFSLYVDEFQNFSTDSFASILSEARKYRLNLIVANQYVGQLTDQIRDAVFGNVGTILSYRTGPEDAEYLAKQFTPIFDARDLLNMPNYNAVMRLMMNNMPSSPFSIAMLPPLGVEHAEMGLAIKQLSAAKFGRPKAQVEAEIFGRLRGETPPAAPAAPKETAAAPAPAVTPAPAPTADPKPVASPTPEPATESATEPAAPVQSDPEPAPAPAPTPPPAEEHGVLSLSKLKQAGESRPKPEPILEPVTPPADGVAPEPAMETAPQPQPALKTVAAPDKTVFTLPKTPPAELVEAAKDDVAEVVEEPVQAAKPEVVLDTPEPKPEPAKEDTQEADKPELSLISNHGRPEKTDSDEVVDPEPESTRPVLEVPDKIERPEPPKRRKDHVAPPSVPATAPVKPAAPAVPVPDDDAAAEELLHKLQAEHKAHEAELEAQSEEVGDDASGEVIKAATSAEETDGDTLAISATGQILPAGTGVEEQPAMPKVATGTDGAPLPGAQVKPGSQGSPQTKDAAQRVAPGELKVDDNGNIIQS